jgi:hypothetical protein
VIFQKIELMELLRVPGINLHPSKVLCKQLTSLGEKQKEDLLAPLRRAGLDDQLRFKEPPRAYPEISCKQELLEHVRI